MLNAEKFRDEIFDNDNNLICNKLRDVFFRETKENQFKSLGKVVRWLLSEYKEPILYEVEREYLSAVCRPYKVEYILKAGTINNKVCLSVGNYHITPNELKAIIQQCEELGWLENDN